MTNNVQTEKVPTTSADITQDRLDALRQLIPEAFTEGQVDFDKLRAALGDHVDDGPERYTFTWAGKRDAIRLLQTPTTATLVPARDESIDFDDTGHVFIEGENLEVLKLLYKAYFGKVKMIYIDPPYNTGNDFVYPDNYADPLEPYLQLTGQKDAAGNLLTSNTDSSGRFHSNWLSMMYPRLFVARQLLRDDGVIFISIDDGEMPHLRLIMNELFGEEQFIGVFVWKSRHNVDSRNKTGMSSDHEYVLVYGKSIRGRSIDTSKYSNPDDDPRGPWMSDNMVGLATEDKRPNLHYDLIDPETGINYGRPEKGWRYSTKTMGKKIAEDRVLWPSSPDGRPREKKFLADIKNHFTGKSSLLKDAPTTSAGTQEIRSLFDANVFDFPKPLELIRSLIQQGSTEDEEIVLDFFAGACPTAHAVLKQNRSDGHNRKYILVQLPEPTDDGSPAKQRGYETIADIGKDRIRRVSQGLREDTEGKLDLFDEDLGFRTFKLAPSHFKPWAGSPDTDAATYQQQLHLFRDPLIEGWQPEPVIWEIALKEGYPLHSRLTQANVAGHTVFRVTNPDAGQHFHICLEASVTADVPRRLNLTPDDLFVCRDLALDDTTAANLALHCRLKTI